MILKKVFSSGKLLDTHIDAAKRKIFLAATPVGCLSMLVFLWTGLKQGSLSALDAVSLPILTFIFLSLTVLLWRKVISLHTFEVVAYVVALADTLCEFAAICIAIVLGKGSFSPDFMIWLPFIYILCFLTLNTNRALLFAGSFFFSTLIIGLGTLLHFLLRGLVFPNVSMLIQMYFASALYIAVLYLLARIREHYVTELSAAEDLSKLAMIDSLTQVDNRRNLNRVLQEEVKRVERHNLPLSILLFDLDRFKRINDTFGHNTGDRILQEVALKLRQNIRTTDPFGRWGGDEFLCLAINSDGQQAVELAERLRNVLEQHTFDAVEKVTASFGVTTYQMGDTPETLIRRADLGLYKAKEGGRNRVEAVLAGVTLPLFEGEKPYPNEDTQPNQVG
jgi:diguanylate cyclase